MSLPEFSLKGKRVLIIGAGRGIGRGIALVMAEAGADVAVTGLTLTGVGRVAEAVAALGRRGVPLVCDATKQEEMDRLPPQVLDKLGGLDVLINCVGDAIRGPVAVRPDVEGAAMTQAEWQRIMDINLTEAFLGCRAFGPHFLAQRKGNVINISSYSAVRGSALRSAFDAAKAGVAHFTRCLALEWAPYDVRVNALAPGQFQDPEQLSIDDMRQRHEAAARNVPLRRIGQIREVGLLAVYLASDASAYVTGQQFVIDGGQSIGGQGMT